MRRTFSSMLELVKPIPPTPVPSVTMDDTNLPMDVYSGVRWSAAAKYGTQIVEVGTSIFVARIVAPEAYGLLDMAVVITGFLQVFQSLGFGSALVQRPDDTEAVIRDRLEVYENQTRPVAEAYRERGQLVEVDGLGEPDEITARLEHSLMEIRSK